MRDAKAYCIFSCGCIYSVIMG
uniref:Homeobox-DDT domain protein RLT1 isoform X1 n=1 Tax=Rhizophora mucronata TaxID=61149 RepID=A0A2P2J0A2_RHIMU